MTLRKRSANDFREALREQVHHDSTRSRPVSNSQNSSQSPSDENPPRLETEEMVRQLENLRNALYRNGPEPILPVDRLSEGDRAYYRTIHGFDPVNEAIPLDEDGKTYKYEATYELEKDLGLRAAGVTMMARLEVGANIHNRIVFKCQNREATVDCVHTAICKMNAQEFLEAKGWE